MYCRHKTIYPSSETVTSFVDGSYGNKGISLSNASSMFYKSKKKNQNQKKENSLWLWSHKWRVTNLSDKFASKT